MEITREDIAPFTDPPIPDAKNDLVDAWLQSISAQLTALFGADLPPAVAPAVYDIVGQAINRRLYPVGDGNGRIKAQSTGPSSVQYNTGLTALSGWFYPDEANLIGELLGGTGSISSVRTPAPDGIRFGNRQLPTYDPRVGVSGVYYGADDEPEWVDGDQS